MSADLTEKEFSKHLNTKVLANANAETQAELELVEVKGYTSKHEEQSGMERFSIYFQGPPEPYLPQKVYAFKHKQMGEFEMFVVPIAKNEKGFRYESVFNYFKSSEK
jgi:hypothetical protein